LSPNINIERKNKLELIWKGRVWLMLVSIFESDIMEGSTNVKGSCNCKDAQSTTSL